MVDPGRMRSFWRRNNDEKHKLKVGADKAALEVDGNVRTVLFGVGALVIAGSFVEAVAG